MHIDDPRVFEKKGKLYIRSPKQLIQVSKGKCTICGNYFYYRTHNKSAPHKYCSVECRGVSDRGEGNPSWKGGRSLHTDGYIRLQIYGGKGSRGRIFEHTQVMEKHLGRPLLTTETVHHINGIRDDNRLENLELWSNRHPKGQRVQELVEWAKEILALYKDI